MSLVGQLLDVEVGAAAHGGSCVARHDGQVIFVRHALPGERVRVRVTEESKRFARADAVEVLAASAHRIAAPCDYARPAGCGGCDWQHAEGGYQRDIKASIVAEQLRRLAGIDREVVVEALPGDGFGWRTRVRFAVDGDGRAGFRRHRSHQVVAVDRCLIAHPLVEAIGVERTRWDAASEIDVAVSVGSGDHHLRTAVGHGAVMRWADTAPANTAPLVEQAAGHRFRVSPGGFWQVHPDAADALNDAVISALSPVPGERALDLYAGVGLFAVTLAERVGVTGSVTAVESAAAAAGDARVNLAGHPQARVIRSDVLAALGGQTRERARGQTRERARAGQSRQPTVNRADIVVLDPPRAGAGRDVVASIAALGARAIAYVACDPASLARDLATFASVGYSLASLRAFDIFPQTQHVECVALVVPQPRMGGATA